MMRRQGLHKGRMAQFDVQKIKMVGRQFSRQERRGWFAKVQPPQPDFNGDLPAGRHANELSVGGILDHSFGSRTEQHIVVQEPQEGMGVQQQVQSMYSLNSSSGASKLGAMRILPAAMPALHGHEVRSA